MRDSEHFVELERRYSKQVKGGKEMGPLGVKVTIIKPGEFRADFADSSIELSEGRSQYDSTVDTSVRFRRNYIGKQPGNPAKAAAVLLQTSPRSPSHS